MDRGIPPARELENPSSLGWRVVMRTQNCQNPTHGDRLVQPIDVLQQEQEQEQEETDSCKVMY
jgi:hypothetical protein